MYDGPASPRGRGLSSRPGTAYLGAMSLPRPSTPAAAWRDLRAFLGTRNRTQFLFALLAIAMPMLIVLGFVIDSNIRPQAQIIYVESWPANRSEEEILADQKKDQIKRDAIRRERQRQFQELEKRLGM